MSDYLTSEYVLRLNVSFNEIKEIADCFNDEREKLFHALIEKCNTLLDDDVRLHEYDDFLFEMTITIEHDVIKFINRETS